MFARKEKGKKAGMKDGIKETRLVASKAGRKGGMKEEKVTW